MPIPEALAAREKRTFGVFALMLGAGVVLDGGPSSLGISLILLGAALCVWGFLLVQRRAPTAVRTASEPQP